jgi:type IV pilus assembly protein PilP
MASLMIALLAAMAALQAAPAPQRPAAPQPPAAGASQPAAAGTAAQPPQAEVYSYQPEGRRDPFLTLLGTGADSRPNARRGDGAAGITTAEISVRGILQSRTGLVAMIQGPDNKTYIVHQGDKVADGSIKTITSQGLVVMQEVNDPLSLVKQREVTKLLRSLEGAKE